MYIESLPEGSVTSPLLPVILVALASFAVACIFFAVPELIVETTMLTFSKSMAETPGGVDTFCPKARGCASGAEREGGRPVPR